MEKYSADQSLRVMTLSSKQFFLNYLIIHYEVLLLNTKVLQECTFCDLRNSVRLFRFVLYYLSAHTILRKYLYCLILLGFRNSTG